MLYAIAFVALLATGCDRGRPENRVGAPSSARFTLDEFLRELAKGGADPVAGEAVEQPFFPVTGRLVRIAGSDVQASEFADDRTARVHAARISADGSAVGTAKVRWIEPPHFFRRESLIVLYLASEPAVLAALEAVLGPQFAGHAGPEP